MLSENVDLACITESWVLSNEIEYVKIPGYNIVSYFCRKEYIHGGVLILSKSTCSVVVMSDIVNLSVDKIFECAAVKLKISAINYCIICIYRTPNSDVNLFFNKFEESLNRIISRNDTSRIIICGDLNINYLCSENIDTIALKDLTNSFHIKSVFNEPTRISQMTETAVDYILTNFNNSISTANILHTGLSDHTAQKITFQIPNTESVQQVKTRSFSNNNIKKFKQLLEAETWNDVYGEETADNKFMSFINIVENYYNICFPLKTKNINTNKNKNWLTLGLRVSSRKLKELYHMQKMGLVNPDYYNNYKKIYRRLVRQSKKLHFDRIIQNSENKCKTVWKIINNSINNNNNINKNQEIIVNNNLLRDKTEIANTFNSYFVNLPRTITSVNQNNKRSKGNTPVTKHSISLNNVTISEIVDAINNLKNSYSTGHDNISTTIIKKCAQWLAMPLCHILNSCFALGTYPNFLKISKVICLFKKNDPRDITNYRPISLLSVFSKIFERIIFNVIVDFLETRNIFSPSQHGFRKDHSTSTALLSFLDYVYRNLDLGHKVVAIYVDLSKAFDCVDHDILLSKLECYGLRGQCNDLLKSYLTNRKQFVDYLGAKSTNLDISLGIPQGSILGPLLFLLYINDINQHITTFHCAFADDITIATSDKSIALAIDNLSSNLLSISQYFTNNHLIINREKTFFMQFHPINSNYIASPLIMFENKTIQQVKEFKLLGIYIDLSLDWKSHINYICNKCASSCFAIKRLSQIASRDTVKTFYFANFESRIRYGVIFWGYSNLANRVFILQKRAIRYIFGLSYSASCRETFMNKKILTLPCLYILEILIMVKKNPDKFTFQNFHHDYATRHGLNLQYPAHRLELFKSNPYYMGSTLYNKLNENIKNINNVKNFISATRSYLVNHAFYSVNEYLNFH